MPFSKTRTPVKPSCQSEYPGSKTSAGTMRCPQGKWLTAATGLPHPLSLLEEGAARPAPLLVFPAWQGQQRWEKRQVLSMCWETHAQW